MQQGEMLYEGKAKQVFLTDDPDMILILPLAFLLSRLIGPSGVWHAFWICEAITAGISYAIYRQSSI